MNIERVTQIIKEELDVAERKIIHRLSTEGDIGSEDAILPDNPNYAKALEMYEKEGCTHSGVAKALGVSLAAAKKYYNWLVKNGELPPDEAELSDVEKQVVECLFVKKMSLSEAATALNCSVTNIQTRRDSAIRKGFDDGVAKSKYAPLNGYFLKTGKTTIKLSFDEIENIIDDKLPAYLRKWVAGWYGTAEGSPTHYQKKAWCDAGYQVETVDLKSEQVIFKKI